MAEKHPNLRDVGLSLRKQQREAAKGAGQGLGCCEESPVLAAGRLLRCGSISLCSWEELRRPATILNLRMGKEAHLDPSLDVADMLHVPAENKLEKYDTTDPKVQEWLTDVMRVFERVDLKFPVLIHCRSGRDRTGVVVAALLSILGAPEPRITKEFLLSEDAKEKNIKQALAGFKKAGGIEKYFAKPNSKGEVLDLDKVRASLSASCEEEVAWLKKDVELLLRMGKDLSKSVASDEAAYCWAEAASAAAELAGITSFEEAPAALCYRGMALGQLERLEEAREALSLGLALARLETQKPQVLKRLEKELAAVSDDLSEVVMMKIENAQDQPGDPHMPLCLLDVNSKNKWRVLPLPESFSWLRCGELAASVNPTARNLNGMEALGLSCRISAEGPPEGAREEHWEGLVQKMADALAEGKGVLLHCNDGFAASGLGLACFIVLHGLDDPVKKKAGQPKMTAGEASEVVKSLRPGALAGPGDDEVLQNFAEAAWARHVQRTQRAFSSSLANASAGAAPKSGAAASKPAPSSAKVVRQPGDGNCLFHSLAYGLGGSANAASVRADVCTFMVKNADLSIAGTSLTEWIQMLAGSAVEPYAKKMAKSAQWGGAPEIACCANMHKVNVHVYERRGNHFELTVPFDIAGSSRTITVLYVGGVHYDALVF